MHEKQRRQKTTGSEDEDKHVSLFSLSTFIFGPPKLQLKKSKGNLAPAHSLRGIWGQWEGLTTPAHGGSVLYKGIVIAALETAEIPPVQAIIFFRSPEKKD